MDPIRRRDGEDEDGKKETSRGGRLTGVEGFRLVLCGFLFCLVAIESRKSGKEHGVS